MSETFSGESLSSGLALGTVKPAVLERLRRVPSDGQQAPSVLRTRGLVSADLVERLRLTNGELAREKFLASGEEPPRVPASVAVGKWCRQAHNHLRSKELIFKDQSEKWRLKRETAEAILNKDIARRHFRTKPKYETGTAHPLGTHDLHAPVKREPLLVLLETRKLLHMSDLILTQPGAERVGQKPASVPTASQGRSPTSGVTGAASHVPALHATLYALARYGIRTAKPPPETPWPPESEAPSSYTSTFAADSSRSPSSSPSPSYGASSQTAASTSGGASSGTRTVSEEGSIRVDSSRSSVGGQRAPEASSSETHTVSTERSSESEQAKAYSQDFGSEPGVSGVASGAGSGGGSGTNGQRSGGQEDGSEGGGTRAGDHNTARGEYRQELGSHMGAASTLQGGSFQADGAGSYEEDFEEEGPNEASRHEDFGEEEGYEDTFDEEALEEEEEEEEGASGARLSSVRSSLQGDSEQPVSASQEGTNEEDVSEEGISEEPSSHGGASLTHSGSSEESGAKASGRSGSVEEEYTESFGSSDGASLLHSGGSGGATAKETMQGSSVQEEYSEGFGSQDGASLLHSGGSSKESSGRHPSSGVRSESYAETFDEERQNLVSRYEDAFVVEAEASGSEASPTEEASHQHSGSGASGGARSGRQDMGASDGSSSQVSGSGEHGSTAASSQRSGSSVGDGADVASSGQRSQEASGKDSQASSPSLRLQAGASSYGTGSNASAAATPRLAASGRGVGGSGDVGEEAAVERVPVAPELAAHVPSYTTRLPVGVQLHVAGDALAEVLAGSRALFAWAESLLGPCASPAGKGGAAADGQEGSDAEQAAGNGGAIGG